MKASCKICGCTHEVEVSLPFAAELTLPCDTCVEKIVAEQDSERRASQAAEIVEALAEFEPRDETGEYSKCIYCGHDDYVNGSLERKITHADSCPWKRAREWVGQ